MELFAIGVLIGLAVLVVFYRRRRGLAAPVLGRAGDPGRKRHDIEAALHALSTRRNDDAFVFLEDVRTRKYVQFGGGEGRPILFDLPAMALKPEEMKRAVAYFEALGRGSLETFDVAKREGGVPIDRGETYQIRFSPEEAARAAEVALEVFERVYRLPADFTLAIDEN